VALTAVSAAGPSAPPRGPATLDATHVPPLLTLPGEPVRLRYAIVCTPREDGEPCDGSGTVYVRASGRDPYRGLPLQRGAESTDGRYYVDAPSGSFEYYAVLRDNATGATVTVPSGGADAPQLSMPLRDAVEVSLGRHTFGRVRSPTAEVAQASWGPAPQEVGLGGSRELGFSGPSSFDVEPDGSVDLLDSVKGRVLRWTRGGREVVPLAGLTELADFAAEPDGTFDVLEARGLIRHFGPEGTPRWTQKLVDRTWAKLEHGPLVLQQPSEQWMPLADHGGPLSRAEQAKRARVGRRDVFVDRVGENELRLVSGTRAWRVTSETPLGEVQLAEPRGDDVVVVTRAYMDALDEFVVLVLDRTGLAASFSVASDSWTETAPLARFRLARSGLYRLRTTPAGAFVDRFDLEVGP
jgi:hypothetical protein